MARPKKICLGLLNIASQVEDYTYGFNQNGVEVFSVINRKHAEVVSAEVDLNLQELTDQQVSLVAQTLGESDPQFPEFIKAGFQNWNLTKCFNQAVRECDTFFFIWDSFHPEKMDFPQLKQLGKQIIVKFCGGDVRWPPAAEQDFLKYGAAANEYKSSVDARSTEALKRRLQFLRMTELFADMIMGCADTMQLALRPHWTHIQPIRFNLYEDCSEQRERPVVLHAPSNRAGKGTKYILEAVERLKNENCQFDFRLVENVSQEEVMKIYQEVDILVGQVFGTQGGKQERELLAYGKVVLSPNCPGYPLNYFPGCPIIGIKPDTVYQELKAIIPDYQRRQELAKQGRPYVEKYHDIVRHCANILDRLENNTEPEYCPQFFRHHFVPESTENIEIFNQFTEVLKEQEWYKRLVPPGERAGLKF